jgi:flavorubredoxin
MILLDIKNGGTFYEKLIKIMPEVESIKYDEIKKIGFDDNNNLFYVRTKDGKEIKLDEEDLSIVYDKFYRSPDLFDFETIYYGDKIFSCHKYNDIDCTKVFEVKEET